MKKKQERSAYSRDTLRWVRSEAMKIKGAISVRHIYPRAYCVAKPAIMCAVFVTPWMDAEPQIRETEYSSSNMVYNGVQDVRVGDWCALAYVVTSGCQERYAFPLPYKA